jgi:hypothetical protein
VDRTLSNGIRVKAWTFDELYGRDGQFLDGLDERGEAFVGEVPPNFHVWLAQPIVLRKPPKHQGKTGRRAKYPRAGAPHAPPSEVQNLARYSPGFREQRQKYRIKDTCHGPEVWEIQWHTAWRKTHTSGLVSRQGTLIVARNVLTGETKYFFSNRVPGRDGWTLRNLLRVAFGRCQVEACFREVKEELGWDHFECRGWRCIHRHLYVTILSGLFCARVRQRLSPSQLVTSGELLTMEQVRRAADVFTAIDMRPSAGTAGNRTRQRCHQAATRRPFTLDPTAVAHRLGIDPTKSKACSQTAPVLKSNTNGASSWLLSETAIRWQDRSRRLWAEI